MNDWVKRGLIGGGVLYVIAMIPPNIRPSWSTAPFRKPNQTVTVQAVTEKGGVPAVETMNKVDAACKTIWFLRPMMGSAKQVQVLAQWDGRVVASHVYTCTVSK